MVFYALFGFLDYCIYSVVSIVLRLIVIIAHYNFFSDPVIKSFASKVYVILGVLMLFRIVISAIQYLINPDEMDDKNKGLFGVLQRLLICVTILVLVDPIYRFALDVQETVVESIPKIILGSSNDDFGDIGQRMAMDTLKAFYQPKKDKVIDSKNQITNLEEFKDHIYANCNEAKWGFDVFSTTNCVYDYRIFISTAVGIFMLYVLLSMALDIGIRTIKLGLIRILAPIPIGSYITNKDSLSKFGKTVLNVYLDLFIRLGVIYFIIFAIKAVLDSFGGGASFTGLNIVPTDVEKTLVTIVIIIALLMFAKNAPKFICDLIGIDGGGFGDMKEMFQPFWKRTGGLAAPAAAIGAYRNAKDYGDKHGVRRALTAGAHATIARLKDVASGKDLGESYKTAKDAAMARTNRNLEYANRYPDRKTRNKVIWQERFDKYTGVTTGGKKASANIEAANRALKARSNAWGRAQDKVIENASLYKVNPIVDSNGNTLKFSDMYALFEKDAPEMYAGQKRELAAQYQAMKDEASQDFLRLSFIGAGTKDGKVNGNSTDGQARNVFAEDVFAIARSGADKDTVSRLLIDENVKISNGSTVKVDAIDAAKRINAMNNWRAEHPNEPMPQGLAFTDDEAEALAIFARNLNKIAGTVRLQATETQTSEPKSS